MIPYIMILTILVGSDSNSLGNKPAVAATITSIEFNNQEKCQMAADKWISRKPIDIPVKYSYSIICVQK